MDDIIALRCPSCGGHIQVEKNLEKMFCSHCGTQLLLKQGGDGLLMPLMARELSASARMKETEAALIMMETLKDQVKEMEGRVHALRIAFWTQVMQEGKKKTYAGHVYAETDAIRRVNLYAQQLTGIMAIEFRRVQLANDDLLDPEKLARSSILGLTTPDELLAFYQYIVQPQGYDQTAYRLATALFPITTLAPDIKAKKQKLKQVADELYEEFVRS
jgi:hypothetical protein